MAGATFSRIKNWIEEILTYEDLNLEIDNILNNLGPLGVDDYSSNATAMQTQTDPGEVGSESLATSLAGELERLRYVIKELKGGDVDYWYESIPTSLSDIVNLLGSDLTRNRLVSGTDSAFSSAARFLIPGGVTNSFLLEADPVPLVYLINSAQYSISTDITKTTLGLAPATQNTALINETELAGQEFTKRRGMNGNTLTVDAMGTAITSRINQLCGFKVTHSGNTEYFLGFVKSTTEITNCLRGYFFDSTNAVIPPIALYDNDPITLMRLTWVYANTAGNLALSYTNPTYSYDEPVSPATGDYWFNMEVGTWQTYNSTDWIDADAILIGVTIQDTTNCVGARAFDFYTNTDIYNSINPAYVSATVIQQTVMGGKIGVGSGIVRYETTLSAWDITANLETGLTEQASTTYYAYVGENGQTVLSPYAPYYEQGLRKGYYHPYEMWRAVGSIFNDASSNFDASTLVSYAVPTALDSITDMKNLSVIATVASNALTIAIKTKAGTNPTLTEAIQVNFRAASTTTGTYITRTLSGPLSLVVPASASLGHASNVAQYVWVYLIDDNGTMRIGVTGVIPQAENTLQNTTAISGGSTDGAILYADTSLGSKAVRLIARLTVTEGTAGTWATAPSDIALGAKPQYNVTDERTYVPGFSGGWGSTSGHNVSSHREGRWLIVRGIFTAGTVGGSAAQMTTGFNGTNGSVTIDTTLMGGSNQTVGSYATNGNAQSGHILYINSTTDIGFSTTYSTSASQLAVANANGMSPPGGAVTFFFKLPILGWSAFGP